MDPISSAEHSVSTRPASSRPECIRLRGVRQNNLKGFDLDLPLGKYVVVTGLSGAGKSSLVFDTLHAEGQRRYVETFSAYTRQFLDLLDKPKVDAIENVRPSIAIEQTNTVKTSRSTVGTMTELTDYFKVWFSHVAECFDPVSGEKVEDDTPQSVWEKTAAARHGRTLLVGFAVRRPSNLTWKEILTNLKGQAYVRVLIDESTSSSPANRSVRRIEDLLDDPAPLKRMETLVTLQDRLLIADDNRVRFLEAAETAMHFGQGQVHLFDAETLAEAGRFSRGLHSPSTGRTFRAASPALFSFNSPLGACPQCRGFGRIIEIDYRLAIPDGSLSIDEGAIKCWEGEVYGASKEDLVGVARKRKIPTDVPFSQLTEAQRRFVIDGEEGYGENGREWPKAWYGVKGFFRWLEKNTYKMHVRVFLSRYRAYNPCPACGGTRLQPESLCWKWRGLTLPELYALPVNELHARLQSAAQAGGVNGSAHSAAIAYESILTRLRYLAEVGLGYLTLDRPSKTLSGGEVQRVNLTSCLGTSLVDTLFVLDEPSVGLHPRDINRLISIVRSLTDAGNTVVVVEHDESMIRAADHVIEIGPEPGRRGGSIVFQGSLEALLLSPASLTGAYLAGRRQVSLPARRRPVSPGHPHLRLSRVSKHNLNAVDVDIPLQRLVCLSGVSGSGKSTLMDHAIHQGLLNRSHQLTEDPAQIGDITCDLEFSEVVLVDQSPLSRTPRSNPALYTEAWELIRERFAQVPAARERGFSSSSFSFNSGDGRCDHCQGLGYERVEMQFLSDVFVPCPICEGKRFKPEVLAIEWNGRSVADLLATTVAEALPLFRDEPEIKRRLSALADVGLDYLTLGQPINTLSGGEAQRLKLVRYLGVFASDTPSHALLLLDEPTTGLHRHDVVRLLGVLQALVDRGHSVVVIEHNLDVLKSADWIIEIGPDAGALGGRIVAAGTPEAAARAQTATAPFLTEALKGNEGHGSPARLLAAESPGTYSVQPSTNGMSHAHALTLLGARENNLKNLSLSLPHRELTVVTGVSGSGKSTLAFDIVFAEGQRRFMEAMSPYARQFVEQLPRPDIDRLTGIPPTVAIEQRVTRGSRKSTVATITEVAQYLRLLYARLGVQHHPDSDKPVEPLSVGQLKRLLNRVTATPRARRGKHLYLCAPLIRGRKGHHQPIATWILEHGFELMRVDGRFVRADAFEKLDRYREHDIEVVIGDLKAAPSHSARSAEPVRAKTKGRARVVQRQLKSTGEYLQEALQLGKGSCFLATPQGEILSWFSTTRTDIETGESFPELDPKHFSHNSPRGWCPTCRGHGRVFPWMLAADEEEKEDGKDDPAVRLRLFGIESENDVSSEGTPCPDCRGERLNRVVRAVKLHLRGGKKPLSLPALLRSTPSELLVSLRRLDLDRRGKLITQDIVPQIEERLRFLDHVGLGYLSMDRPTETLSGGEAQRIRLAAQLGTNLAGVLYVLDEPSIGLHARDNDRLIETLVSLKEKGNSLLVVEHDDGLMERADRIIDLGPGAGVHGGELLANGTPAEIKRSDRSLTGLFLARGITHPSRGTYREIHEGKRREGWLQLTGARFRNLKGFNLAIPPGRLVMVAGPSGAGKSTLFRDLLHPAVKYAIGANRPLVTGGEFVRKTSFESGSLLPAKGTTVLAAAPFDELIGGNAFRTVVEVDQSPIGKTPRSTPATYLGIFDLIRQFFASLPESKMRGYGPGRFSFNTTGGRCPTCEGGGRIRMEMAFMPDTYLPCDDCRGLRYGAELSDITWKGKNIGEVLRLTFDEATIFFDFHSQLSQVCKLMVDCGLGYLTLGQSSPTLSGGEAQRLKLVTELSHGLASYKERSRGIQPRNLYLLEEPTIGLHLSDCERLIAVLHALVEQGHTVVVIEHHLDLLAEADWIVELGPSGGPAGGELIYQGPLKGLLTCKRSPTAPYLQKKISDVG
ncbi:MAG: excinuclease ABC subunit UvrA [Opitutaceae bacterium]|nr:excinuclease ABC subunit UvrA [Opitutaceae bacterium]